MSRTRFTSDPIGARQVWRPTPSLRSGGAAAWSLPHRSRGRAAFRWLVSLVSSGLVALILAFMIRADVVLRDSATLIDDPRPAAALWDDWVAAIDVDASRAMPLSPARAGEETRLAPESISYLMQDYEPSPANPNVATAAVADDRAHFIRVDITGYSSRVEETDADPFITAMCTLTAPGVVALSRDLLRTFTPGAPFDFGDKILIPGVGVYSVEDTMHPRWIHRVDIWFPSTAEAFAWGRRTAFIAEIEEETPVLAYRVDFDRTGVIELTP